MEKFLFCEGTDGVIEVHSTEELVSLLRDARDPGQVRIWKFGSDEWTGYADFIKQGSVPDPAVSKARKTAQPVMNAAAGRQKWLKKFLFAVTLLGGAFLVFNFTRVRWDKAEPLSATAVRPANVPVMDIDSLVAEIESTRNRSLDRSTRLNLRLRNTWPENILLHLQAEKETGNAGSRFFRLRISIDNTTGFPVDEAVVDLRTWKNGVATITDTLRFSGIRFDKLSLRELPGLFRGDSLSVSFRSLRARAFNFCYSADVKNNLANYYDRWFCPAGGQ